MKPIFALLPLASALLLAACAETQFGANMAKQITKDSRSQGTYKVGNPYIIEGQEYYPQESFNYSEVGIASWYGPGFHGKKTANGETYDQNELTAAHRTLQMPSLVRVTNLENGRAVVLRVNDRGPFSRGRIIDLSSKAADLLDVKRKGTARVKVETLSAESRMIAEHARAGKDTRGYEIALNGNKPASGPVTFYPDQSAISVQTASADDTMGVARVASVESVPLDPSRAQPVQGHVSPDGRFMPDPVVTQTAPVKTNIFVQAGAFSDESNALRLSQSLASTGNSRVYHTNIGGRDFFRVRLGPYESVEAADAALAQVTAGAAPQARIVVE
ncbi:MAG: septal ring lytic transglycosylase RlpA family protein [Micavibrio sp.]